MAFFAIPQSVALLSARLIGEHRQRQDGGFPWCALVWDCSFEYTLAYSVHPPSVCDWKAWWEASFNLEKPTAERKRT